jgi:c-di-GMP-binding flagellar brake protein YcgR
VASAEHRRLYRYPVHWRIALVHKNGDKNDIYHGRTHDLSAGGASVFVDHNIFVMSEVVLLLAIPPLHPGQKETLIEIDCRMAYTILDSEQSRFRIGLRFLHFKGEGKRILSDILSKRVIPKSEINQG